MPIELKFTADSYEELVEQVLAFGWRSTDTYKEAEVKEADQVRKAFAATHAKKRSVKAVMEEQAPPPQEVFEQEDPIVEEVMVDETAATNGALSAKALLDLKARMLTTLQAAIAEGKIDKLRAILQTHGGGAKSFPEVAPVQFVEIEKAVKEGALT